jgi:hypothetical protein
MDDIRAQGTITIRKIAEELNQRGILAPRGGEWQPTTVAPVSSVARAGRLEAVSGRGTMAREFLCHDGFR